VAANSVENSSAVLMLLLNVQTVYELNVDFSREVFFFFEFADSYTVSDLRNEISDCKLGFQCISEVYVQFRFKGCARDALEPCMAYWREVSCSITLFTCPVRLPAVA
jgi:hypothetical protein